MQVELTKQNIILLDRYKSELLKKNRFNTVSKTQMVNIILVDIIPELIAVTKTEKKK